MKTVIECELRGPYTLCLVCGHLPPDYCGKDAVVASLDAFYQPEGAPAQPTPEKPASEAPKVSRSPRVKT